jgi:hypothetical protein
LWIVEREASPSKAEDPQESQHLHEPTGEKGLFVEATNKAPANQP